MTLRQPVFDGSIIHDRGWHRDKTPEEIGDDLGRNIEDEAKMIHRLLPSIIAELHRPDCAYAVRITVVQELEG